MRFMAVAEPVRVACATQAMEPMVIRKIASCALLAFACSGVANATNPVLRIIVKNETAEVARLLMDINAPHATYQRTSPHPAVEILPGSMCLRFCLFLALF